jgi:hypothetical protein
MFYRAEAAADTGNRVFKRRAIRVPSVPGSAGQRRSGIYGEIRKRSR